MSPLLSIIIPVYNEEDGLEALFARLIPVLKATNHAFEIIAVNDGSRDHSQRVLDDLCQKYPKENLRVVQFIRNYGQQFAILAGLEHMRGQIAITMDADLQNPPEDIPKLLALIDNGHDVVSGYRSNRHDPLYRRFVSKLSNAIRNLITDISMRDHGCAFRAYHKDVVDRVLSAADANSTFISLTSHYYAVNPIEVAIGHEGRAYGRSKYNSYKLLRANFDLITSFSLVPLQVFTLVAVCVSVLSGLFAIYSIALSILFPSNTHSIYALLSVLLFLVGLTMLGIGLIGEYIGRIYKEIRLRRPYILKDSNQQKKPIK